MTLTIFLPSLAGGGAERAMLNLATALHARREDVELVLARAEGPFLADVPAGLRVVGLGAPRMARAIRPLARHLRARRPRALLATLPHANVAAVLARRLARVPVRLVLREANVVAEKAAHERTWRGRAMPWLMRRAYRDADALVAVSQAVAEDLARLRLPRERIRVIPNPVVTADLLAQAEAAPAHPWLRDGGPPVVLGVGRLTAQKDFPALLRAFAQVRARRPARLVVLGEGEDRDALLRLARDLGVAADVALPGFDPNPFAAMARCGVLVLSSRWEGMPNVLLQAMACGAPVVSTDCPSGPREVLGDVAPEALVPVGDAAAMARAIEAALDGAAPTKALQARAFEFHVDRVVGRYREVLAA